MAVKRIYLYSLAILLNSGTVTTFIADFNKMKLKNMSSHVFKIAKFLKLFIQIVFILNSLIVFYFMCRNFAKYYQCDLTWYIYIYRLVSLNTLLSNLSQRLSVFSQAV